MSGRLFKLISKTKPAQNAQPGKVAADNKEDAQALAKRLCVCSEAAARNLIPYNLALKLKVLPLAIIDIGGRELLTVAAAEPTDGELLSNLRFITDREVRAAPCNGSVLELAIFMSYHGDENELAARLEGIQSEEARKPSAKSGLEMLEFRRAEGAAGILSALTDYAISQHASDLHFSPRIDGCYVTIRIDGELRSHPKAVCSAATHSQIIARLKVLCGLDNTQRQVAQDGSFRVPVEKRMVDIRVSIMPTIHGEKAVLRFFGLQSVLDLQTLGFGAEALHLLEKFLVKQEGALLVSGPTGSGKSSTLYAIINELSRRNLSCSSIEDPVELVLPGVAQTSINPKVGADYAECLRAVLRQDPDCILLGEIRDRASAEIALQAAITGHLLISTVHARTIREIILRLRHFKLDPLTIAQALGLLVNQRLLPRLCPRCKVLDLEAARSFDAQVYKEVGCSECFYSGFSGQVLAYEILAIDAALTDKLARGRIPLGTKPLESRDGFYPLTTCLEKLLRAGMINAEQFETYRTTA